MSKIVRLQVRELYPLVPAPFLVDLWIGDRMVASWHGDTKADAVGGVVAYYRKARKVAAKRG